MIANTTGTGNVAMGTYDGTALQPLKANTTGNSNIAIGSGALSTNSTGSYNTAVGWKALTTQNADRNTAFGYEAGRDLS